MAQLAQVVRVDSQVTREGAAQNLVGRDQSAQPFVDLAVHALAPPLNGEHHQQPDANADQRDQGEAQKGRNNPLPGTEIYISQNRLCNKALGWGTCAILDSFQIVAAL